MMARTGKYFSCFLSTLLLLRLENVESFTMGAPDSACQGKHWNYLCFQIILKATSSCFMHLPAKQIVIITVAAMTPGHGVSPQTSSPAPAQLSISRPAVEPGQELSITLSASNSSFKGFIIQARDSKIKDRQVSVECKYSSSYNHHHCSLVLLQQSYHTV